MIQLHLEPRLSQLKSEYESGQRMLAALEDKQHNLRDTLLRISGAIQVLEELLAAAAPTKEIVRVGEEGSASNGAE